MRKQQRWMTILIVGVMVTGMEQACFGEPVGLYFYRGTRLSDMPGMWEFHYSLIAMDSWSCPHECWQGCCAPDGCFPSWAPTVPCYHWYCWSAPDHYFLVCGGRSWFCMNYKNECITMDPEHPDCFTGLYPTPGTGIKTIGLPPGGLDQNNLQEFITIDICKDHWLTPEWLPTYGDLLCFTIYVSVYMRVIITLETSTYEGIAMNADLPDDPYLTDPIGDIVPWSVEGVIEFDSSYFDGTRNKYMWAGELSPRSPAVVWVRVQDYAAAASLTAEAADAPRIQAAVQIPYNYERFWSDADPDRDGFTNWEEYRGFITSCGGTACHTRMDSSRPDFFIDDQMGYIDWNAVQCASGYFPWTAHNWPVLIGDYRHWLDFMVARTGNLTEAGYDPPGFDIGHPVTEFDQAVDVIVGNPYILPDTLGYVVHVLLDTLSPPTLYRGPSGNKGAVQISWWNHVLLVNNWRTNCGLPDTLVSEVFDERLERTYLHELGHTLGVNHHNPDTLGSHDCVMKYEVETDFFPWENYTWGLGYLNDDWNCANEKGLRP